MSEVQQFYDLESVEPLPTDGLLLARERIPKSTTVAQLMKGAISFSQTPPETGHLWGQLDNDDNLIELWQRRGSLWLSFEAFSIKSYRSYVTGSTTRQAALPYFNTQLWIERFSYQCIAAGDFKTNEQADFQLRLVNSSRQQVVKWYLRLEDANRNQAYQVSEKVELVVAPADAIALWFRVQRNNRTGLRYVSMSTLLRKVYAST